LADIKEKEMDPNLDTDLEQDKGKWIIDAKSSATITTKNIQLDDSKELVEEECLLYS
jgi:hypothetical protein